MTYKFKPGDRFHHPGGGSGGEILKVSIDPITGRHIYIHTYDSQPGKEFNSPIPYFDIQYSHKPKVYTGAKAQIKINGKVIGTFGEVSVDTSRPFGAIPVVEYSPGDQVEVKEMQAEITGTLKRGPSSCLVMSCEPIDVGFTHSKWVCKYCGKDLPDAN